MEKIIVAIDGFSSSGKSTMARELARKVGYVYVDSGAMYRAVTLFALRNGIIDADNNVDTSRLSEALPRLEVDFAVAGGDGIQHTLLNGEDVEKEIREMKVSNSVSPVAAIPEVRAMLVSWQRQLGEKKGIVMDGRDIGTTVFPNAELKIFVCASAEERAKRRLAELKAKGETVSYGEVLANVEERDRIDTTREVSPLRKSYDAIELDNGKMTKEEQMQWLLDQFHKAVEKASSGQ